LYTHVFAIAIVFIPKKLLLFFVLFFGGAKKGQKKNLKILVSIAITPADPFTKIVHRTISKRSVLVLFSSMEKRTDKRKSLCHSEGAQRL
jgi:hypothetical protein